MRRRLLLVAVVAVALGQCSPPAYAARIQTDEGRMPVALVVQQADPVERWAPLVASHFKPADVDLALRIIECETDPPGDPNSKNPTSSASGLFQHLRMWYDGTWSFDPFDPRESVKYGAKLFYDGGPSHWNASRACWAGTAGRYSGATIRVELDVIAGPDGVEVDVSEVTVP